MNYFGFFAKLECLVYLLPQGSFSSTYATASNGREQNAENT